MEDGQVLINTAVTLFSTMAGISGVTAGLLIALVPLNRERQALIRSNYHHMIKILNDWTNESIDAGDEDTAKSYLNQMTSIQDGYNSHKVDYTRRNSSIALTIKFSMIGASVQIFLMIVVLPFRNYAEIIYTAMVFSLVAGISLFHETYKLYKQIAKEESEAT